MTPEQIERLKTDAELLKENGADLRALLAEWEEAKRERDAFVAVLDPDGKNVVSAMVAAQERGREIERLKAELRVWQECSARQDHELDDAGQKLERAEEEHRQELRERTGEYIAAMEQMQTEIERLKAEKGELAAALDRCRSGREDLFQKAARLSKDWQQAEARLAKFRAVLAAVQSTEEPLPCCAGTIPPGCHSCPCAKKAETRLREMVKAAQHCGLAISHGCSCPALAAAQQEEEK